jgi:hypothetical protein
MTRGRSKADKSALVSASGMMSNIWIELRAAVLKRGATVAPIVQVAWSMLLPWLIAVCRFTYYMNPNITAEHFPLQFSDLPGLGRTFVRLGLGLRLRRRPQVVSLAPSDFRPGLSFFVGIYESVLYVTIVTYNTE